MAHICVRKQFLRNRNVFLETRALLRVNGNNAGQVDLGYYRELPPLNPNAPSDASSFRIFLADTNNNLSVLSRDGGSSAPLSSIDVADPDLTQYHNFRIEWSQTETRYYVDGSQIANVTPSISTLLSWVFLYTQEPSRPMQVDWVRAGVYTGSGTYESCPQDAGAVANWTGLDGVVTQPSGTTISYRTRTSLDGVNWSEWAVVNGSSISSPAGRYLQYEVTLGTSDLLNSPEVQQVSLSYQTVSGTATNTPTPTNTPVPPTATSTATPTNTPEGTMLITQTSAGDFGASCSVLNSVSVSNAAGGEVRLAATVEDYFDGTTINSSRWVTGSTYEWYTVPPSVGDGLLTLDAAYLRSQVGFNQSTPVRFFEARAMQRINSDNASWPDLGFYRELPPLAYGSGPYPNDSSLRIFVTRDTNTTYIRGRDGDASNPLIDVDIPTINLTQYHDFRIEWDASETRFYIDGVFQGTIVGSSALNTWVFLYSQDPSTSSGGRSPMQIDWVRAGAYPTNGTYTSCAQDAGQVVTWATLASTGNTPANTNISFSTRTSLDANNWSEWLPVSNGNIGSPAGRYLQYRMELSSSNVLVSPEVQQVNLSYQL
ncbi:MAG: family 16 glycosylhydrolase [Anaerolineales bacterium]|nr:family 16 glycosylhydrolase [Anaerolineales bacterium]